MQNIEPHKFDINIEQAAELTDKYYKDRVMR